MPSTNTYYILQYGLCYLTSFVWFNSSESYPAVQFQTDILSAQRMDLDTVTNIYNKLGGTVIKCTETYVDGLADVIATNTSSSASSSASSSDSSSASSSESANYKSVVQ